MSANVVKVRLVFPHQLYIEHLQAEANTIMVLIEDDLFFRQYPFHKQKLMLHRASIRHFADLLKNKKFEVVTIETSAKKSFLELESVLVKLKVVDISYFEVTDDWLQQAIDTLTKNLGITAQRLNSPGFLTTQGLVHEYFDTHPNRMKNFYEWQRKRLNILIDGTKPIGGKWSFDIENRKKLPKNASLPAIYVIPNSYHIEDAKLWVEKYFSKNPGSVSSFSYPVTHEQANNQLRAFISERLASFGPYEDAIAADESQLFHSVLSPLLNIGLLTPQQVVDAVHTYAYDHEVPIESLEGFIRQVVGWREYIRATYIRYGRKMRTSNHLQSDRHLASGWWNGSVGLKPIDITIKRVLKTGYAHHIERLMILGNAMVLLQIHPDEVYEWFMSMFIDAYDWVMVPNVYAMSQFAVNDIITTKPYISGSNYIRKMSDYRKGDWSEIWDALYWQFVHDKRVIIEKNYRTRMIATLYDRFPDTKKHDISIIAKEWLD